MIPGGYYLKARKVKNSPVHKMPPYVREIWDYLIREANHSDGFVGPYTIKRGQLFRTYLDIREDLCWYVGYRKMMYNENHTKHAMKALRDAGMISTTKALGGVLITVIKFDYYQTPSNYERTSEQESKKHTNQPRKHQGTPVNNKKNKNVIYSEDSIEFRVGKFLLNNIQKRKPDFKQPNLQTWAKDSDMILRIDKRDLEEVKKVIVWSQLDDFWQDNILSVSKLRIQYDRLVLKMKKSGPVSDNGKAAAQKEYEETNRLLYGDDHE